MMGFSNTPLSAVSHVDPASMIQCAVVGVTSTRKANDIVQAQADMRALGQRILKLKGKIATRTVAPPGNHH